MSAVGPLPLTLLVVAIAGTAAVCGFLASAVMLRNKRRARRYFMLGVLAGLVAGEITRGRYRRVIALRAVVPLRVLALASRLRRIAERAVAAR